MAHEAQHFPTFNKVARAIKAPKAQDVMPWIFQTVFTEWGLLRLSLYMILALCVVHGAATRVVMLESGMNNMGYLNPNGLRGFGDGGGVFHWILIGTHFVLGPAAGFIDMVGAAICLTGLAASARRPKPFRRRFAEEPTYSIEQEPIPEHKEPSRPPSRHPLDPEPGDLPLDPRWRRNKPGSSS